SEEGSGAGNRSGAQREALEGIRRIQEEFRQVIGCEAHGRACFAVARGQEKSSMLRQSVMALLSVAVVCHLSGCMVNETKPLPKINPIQAKTQIPQDELLDVGIHEFDTNITTEQAKDTEKLAKQHIYPDIRKAESRFIPSMLRQTLESSGQWGAVRVIPANLEFIDVSVTGRIIESTGAKLAVEVSVTDSTGHPWITKKRYESPADTGSYKTDASLKARDPFQNVYSQIANDMVAARDQLTADNRREIRRVTELRFAKDLAPQAMGGYLAKDAKSGQLTTVRLPAENDPYTARIEKIRERDAGVVDAVNGYYANFSDSMKDSYGNWRRSSFDEIEKENRARNQARTRTVLGAAAVLASVFVPGQCNAYDYNCRRLLGPEEILRCEGSRASAEGNRGLVPERSAAAGRRRRRPHAASHRNGG